MPKNKLKCTELCGCCIKSNESKNAESENSDPLLTDEEDDGDININTVCKYRNKDPLGQIKQSQTTSWFHCLAEMFYY